MPRWRCDNVSGLRRAFLLAAFCGLTSFLLLHHHFDIHHHNERPQIHKPFYPPTALPVSDDELSVQPPQAAFNFSDEFFLQPWPPETEASDRVARERGVATCATVETMGEENAARGSAEAPSLRVRELIRRHFQLHGAEKVRALPADEFCKKGFVLAKASEGGFGNEMYRILTAAALSVMLNRSLVIGQIRGSSPFGEYISYTNQSFTTEEIKHLWRKHHCASTYGRDLNMRVDNFGKPSETNVLCSDWNSWKDPIIWFQGTTDSVGIQFFLKNVHTGMKSAASTLFGLTDSLHARPNTFGELMRAIISPSRNVQKAVQWALNGLTPDIVLHMRMMSNRPVRARKAAVNCVKRAIQICQLNGTPRVALISDTPSFLEELRQDIGSFAEVISFDYKLFAKSFDIEIHGDNKPLDPRSRDWGPAPRWVAIVDFFVASHAKHAAISGAHRRVGTTYAQLIAASAAANRHGQDLRGAQFTFLSSFHSNLLVDGLSRQVGWGHIWNRYAGPLSCKGQAHQCALTPLLPHAWWDGQWQSPIPRDVRRLSQYGVRLSTTGEVDDRRLMSFCRSRKDHVQVYHVLPPYHNST